MQCSICGSETSILSSKKISDGVLCRKCIQSLPKSIMTNLNSYCLANIESIQDYMGNIRKDLFLPTASFGSLHIDEIHGFFAIEEHLKDGAYEDLTDIFYCLSLKEVGLTPTNVAVDCSGCVTCDFELHCWFSYPECSFTVSVRKHVLCPSKRTGKTELTYVLPGDYHIFVKMFDNMCEVARKKYEDQNKEHFISYPAFQKLKARTMFMLGDVYDMEELRSQYYKLTEAFAGDPERISLISHAYHILADGLKGEVCDE